MIRLTTDKEKTKLCELAKSVKLSYAEADFSIDDGSLYYAYFDDEDILAYIKARPLTLKLKDHFLKVSLLDDVVILDEDKKIEEELIMATIDMLEHSELISLVKTSRPQFYLHHGFKHLYPRYLYFFDKYSFRMDDTSDIKPLADPVAMLEVYAKMMRSFDGFEVRDVHFYEKKIEALKVRDTGIFAVYDSYDHLRAYFSLTLGTDVAMIDEVVYLSLEALNKAISYALKYAPSVIVKTSVYEDLTRVYPEIKKERASYVLARLDHKELFDKLYGTDIDGIYKALTLAGRPLWFNDLR